MHTWGGFLALGLLLAAQPVYAEESTRVEGRLKVEAPLRFWERAAVFEADWPVGSGIRITGSHTTIWQHHYNVTEPLGDLGLPLGGSFEWVSVPWNVSDGRFTFGRRAGMSFEARLASHADHDLEVLTGDHGCEVSTEPMPWRMRLAARCAQAPRSVMGDFLAVLASGELKVEEGATAQAGSRLMAEVRRQTNGTNPLYVDERSVWLSLVFNEPTAQVQSLDALHERPFSADAIEVEGTLLVPPSTGTLTVNSLERTGRFPEQRWVGRFTVRPLGEDSFWVQGVLKPSGGTPLAMEEGPMAAWILGGTAAAFGLWRRHRWLRGLPWAPLFSRVERDRALDHPIRALLHGLIERHPGASTLELVELSGLNRGTVRHHLGVLRRAQIVRTEGDGARSAHFLAGQRIAVPPRRLRILRRPEVQALQELAEREPDLSERELARRLGRPRTTVSRWLRHLRDPPSSPGPIDGQAP